MNFFLGTVSRYSPQNWELAKGVGLWGVSASRVRTARATEEGDRLIIWLGGRGYVAVCLINGSSRSPRNATEAPWEGGTYQWAAVVPFSIELEVPDPVWLPFKGDRQEKTGFSKARFRSSFQRLPDTDGRSIVTLLRKRASEEQRAE